MEHAPDERASLPAHACLLVYDGQCRLCVGVKHRLEQAGVSRAASDVRFVPYDSEAAKQALGARYLPGRPDVAFLVSPSGEVREGLQAFLPLLPRLPGGRAFHWLLGLPLIRTAAEWGYRTVARHRYRVFGKVDSVQSPD